MSGTFVGSACLDGSQDSGLTGATNNNGWIQINDSQFTTSSPLVLNSGSRTKILNNKDSVIDTFAFPFGQNIWDSSLNKIQVDNVGDTYLLVILYDVFVVTNNQFLKWEIDIGGTFGSILTIPDEQLVSGAGERPERFVTLPLYQLNTFASNGAEIFLTASGSAEVYNIKFVFHRLNNGALG